jgi:predicted MFS family arabinose efflux permease
MFAARMTKKEKTLLFVLAAINFTNIMDFMIMMPLGPQLMRLFQIGPQEFSIVVSSYTFSAFVSGMMSSMIIDRFDRKKSLLFMYAGFILGTFLCGMANSYYLLIAARIFTGLFGGVIGATVLSIVGDLIPFERRGQAMGIVMSSFSVASIVGVPFGLFIATHSSFGWQAPFLFLAVFGLPIFAMVYRMLPAISAHLEDRDKKQPILKVFANIIEEPNQRKAILLSMVMMLGHFAIIPFISPSMVANVGFSESELQYIYLVGGLATIFTSPYIGKMSDQYGKFKIFAIFASLCALPVFAITNMPQISIYWALAVAAIFFIFVSGRMIPMQAMITASVNPKYRGSFMSINSSLQQLMAGLGSLLSGLIVVKDEVSGKLLNYQYVGYVSILMGFLAIYLASQLKNSEGKSF